MLSLRSAAGVALLATAALGAGACDRRSLFKKPEAHAATATQPAPGGSPPGSNTVTPKVEPSAAAQALSDAFASAAQAIRPSVVRLDVEGAAPHAAGRTRGGRAEPEDAPDFLRRFFGMPDQELPAPKMQGTGSGIIIDAAGDILTNGHVVHGVSKVTIKLPDQRSFPGRVVGTDLLTDVGVVKFEKPPSDLVAARIGDSDKLRIGEWVIAVGSPLGMDQTVTAGIVSGTGETGTRFRFQSGERVRKYIQTDAEINPGNSGGPLVNLEGEVLGLNTLINVGPGGSYGFAIPINQASQVAGTLIKEGRVRYPFLGVSVIGMEDAPKELLDKVGKNLPKQGALVAAVTPGGPAATAGIRPGDVITKVGGRPVKVGGDVVANVSEQPIGGTTGIDYVRDGASRSVQVKIGEYPGQSEAGGGAHIGVALQTLTAPIAQSLGLPASTKGAVVAEVEEGSPADKAGLAVGDVIREIDKKPIATVEDAAAALRSGKKAHLLRVTSASGTRFITVTPE
ncbi:MAG TPA: trypsin-like peptidase domain-containing protein [Polyangia bacterium]|jgi:serine protease Do